MKHRKASVVAVLGLFAGLVFGVLGRGAYARRAAVEAGHARWGGEEGWSWNYRCRDFGPPRNRSWLTPEELEEERERRTSHEGRKQSYARSIESHKEWADAWRAKACEEEAKANLMQERHEAWLKGLEKKRRTQPALDLKDKVEAPTWGDLPPEEKP